MAYRTVRFFCPIGADTCKFKVECADGTKYEYELGENREADLCLGINTPILLMSQYGSWQDLNTNCNTNCGEADDTVLIEYEYYEYDDCDSGLKQTFRGTYDPPTLWPNVVRYNSKCWHNPVVTINRSNVNVSSLESFIDCASCNTVPTPSPSPSPVPTSTAYPEYCLIQTNPVTVWEIDLTSLGYGTGRAYLFNGAYGIYKVQLGQYTLSGVPSAHPMAILNYGLDTLISYTGQYNAGTKTGPDGYSYTYYYGDITINVNGDFGAVSYACYFHGK